MAAALNLLRRLRPTNVDACQASPDASGDIAPVLASRIAVLCILAILAVLAYWFFLMIAMPETQPAFAIFFDR